MGTKYFLTLRASGLVLLCAAVALFPSTAAACNEFEFQCDNSQCIRSIYRCDLEPDCIDGSDEIGCDDVSCTDDLFKCSSGRCIPKAFICDTDADCDDGTDEQNCSYKAYDPSVLPTPARPTTTSLGRNCEDWQFQCGNGNCIRGTYQCDDDKDCPDGSDEFGCEPCVTTNKLEFGGPPFCKVRIYKGSSRVRNETQCVHDDVFLVKPGRLMPYDRRSYTEAKVNYVRIICDSFYPVDFNYDGVGHIEQIRVLRTQKTGLSGTPVHSTDVTTVVTPQATGNYIFSQIFTNTSTVPKTTALFFYFEKERKPFLLGNERIQKATRKPGESWVTLPCVTAKVNITLYLYKNINETWSRVNSSQYTYNPLRGFQLNVTNVDSKEYKCTTDASFTSDVDVVTVTVGDELLSPTPLAPKEPNLKIVLGPGLSSTCHSIRPLQGSKLEFTNVYAENPLDAKILADCVLKGSLSCGSYSHVRNHHPVSDDLKCRHGNQKTKCRHISEIYTQGVLVCQSESEYLVQRYFTGLDDVLYKDNDWRNVPKSALIRIETTSNLTSGLAGNSMTTKCTAVGMVFARNAITFESRSNGTDMVVKHSSGGYHSYSYTLRVNMSQFLCADQIWETNQEIWSDPINITVTPRIIICSYLEFKCLSGQCIRSSYKCDGDRDCLDASDELNCPSTTTTTTTEAPVRCSALHFYCHKYKNANETSDPCIPIPYRCDGDADCHFGEDEENCPSTTTSTTTTTTEIPNGGCGLNMFKCYNGDCIRASYKCDLREDCKDGSDEGTEAGCPATTTTPRPTSTQISHDEEEAQAEEIGLLLDEEHKSKQAQAPPASRTSAVNVTLILFAVILVIVLLSLGGVLLHRRYQSHGSRGTSSASNIKYRNPVADQEEVLID